MRKIRRDATLSALARDAMAAPVPVLAPSVPCCRPGFPCGPHALELHRMEQDARTRMAARRLTVRAFPDV
jgi:hypothetical protein